MALPIFVVGSSNTDMVVKAERLPMPGETVIGGAFLMNPGGKGANQAVAAARLGSKVTLVAKVGNDLFGKQAVQQFQRESITTTFVTIDPEHPSGVALIGVDAVGENSIMVAPGSNAHLSTKAVEQALDSVDSEAIILVQLEIPIATVEFAIDKARQKGWKTILNPAPVHAIGKDVLKHVYCLTPNEFEAEMLTGIKVTDVGTAELAALRLHDLGVANVVITLGSRGAYLHTASEAKLITPPLVTAIDTTAAGDCFNAALAVGLSEGSSLEKAVAFACKAAAISVTRMGAQSSLPTRKEVDEIPLLSVKL